MKFNLMIFYVGPDDFKFERFGASSPAYFEPYYGPHNDGDVTRPDNIAAFAEVIFKFI